VTHPYRYEIKFVVEETRVIDLLRWAMTQTAMVNKYRSRNVNSLYLDDDTLESATDNLSGISNRSKHRIRWYGAPNATPDAPPVIEIKNRRSSLGFKKTIPFPELHQNVLEWPVGKIAEAANGLLQSTHFHHLLNSHVDLRPFVHINYLREYYEDYRGMRMTVDREILFYRTIPHQQVFTPIPQTYGPRIVEIKFQEEMRDHVSQLMNSLHLSPQRHSKYLAGLASLGMLQYI
jgi:hypothetical protein